MRSINAKRLLLGGTVAGIVLWLLEGAASQMYLNAMQSALLAHDLIIEYSPALWIMSILITLLIGLTMLFFYVVARPLFGPGPKTATLVAFMLWLGGYVPALVGYDMIRLYPRNMLYLWGLVGLLEMIIACIVGAWLYRDPVPAAP